jgi:hypothetical protein
MVNLLMGNHPQTQEVGGRKIQVSEIFFIYPDKWYIIHINGIVMVYYAAGLIGPMKPMM